MSGISTYHPIVVVKRATLGTGQDVTTYLTRMEMVKSLINDGNIGDCYHSSPKHLAAVREIKSYCEQIEAEIKVELRKERRRNAYFDKKKKGKS
jgi:hypothetical protein